MDHRSKGKTPICADLGPGVAKLRYDCPRCNQLIRVTVKFDGLPNLIRHHCGSHLYISWPGFFETGKVIITS